MSSHKGLCTSTRNNSTPAQHIATLLLFSFLFGSSTDPSHSMYVSQYKYVKAALGYSSSEKTILDLEGL